MASIFTTLAIIHIIVYLKIKNEISNLSYSLHNLAITTTLISILMYKFLSIVKFKLFIVLLDISIIFISSSFTFFIFTIFDLKKIKKNIIISYSVVLFFSLFFIITYLITDKIILASLSEFLNAFYAIYLLSIAGFFIIKTKQYKKNKFTKIIFIGIILLLMSYSTFGIIKSIFINLDLTNYIFIPLFIIVFIFEVALINQFKALYINLEQKVNERTRELEYANKQKTDAFINISHEIKMPLTLISNYLDKHIKKYKKTDELEIAIQNIDKLKRDIKNVLDFEKLDKDMPHYDHLQIADSFKYCRKKCFSI